MSEQIDRSGSREHRLDEIIAEYLRRKRAGQAPDERTLLAEHVEFADELREFFADQAQVAKIVEPSARGSRPPQIEETIDSASRAANLASTVDSKVEVPALYGQRYKLKDLHARGGMGEVWLAEDLRIGREVAVKRLLHERASQQPRFQMKAQITGQLEHPGVVRLYDLDVAEGGESYYVMQFVRGKTLKEAIAEFFLIKDDGREDPKPAAAAREPKEIAFFRLIEVFLDLCQTVAYAHSRGVLHRDLKPDNVMLGAFGETFVVDWGLSKVKGQPEDAGAAAYVRTNAGGSTPTQAGSVMGSPPYMSPEAASGQVHEIDEASDVFLLGATLYEILTNRPPRRGSSIREMVDLARSADPIPPRSVNKAVPRALEAICMKAMGRCKAERYPSAMDMASDVRRFLAGEPVTAYREGPAERFARWVKRHRR